MQPLEGTAKTFNAGGDFGMEKLSKVNELNESMSIAPSARDAYESNFSILEVLTNAKQQ